MKKKSVLISFSIAVVLLVLLLIFKPWGSKPLKNIAAEDISKVSVELMPPNTQFDLSQDEINEMTDLLHDIVIYREDSSVDQYSGQAVIYTITKKDGTNLVVNAFSPFVIIDGVGYRTQYGACEKLSSFGNKMNDKYAE